MFGDDIRKNMRELYKERKIIKNCILSMIIIMKTGTLTKNEMTVTKIYDCKKESNLAKLNNQDAVGKINVQVAGDDSSSTRPLNTPKASGSSIEDYFKIEYFNLLKVGLGVNIVATINDLEKI